MTIEHAVNDWNKKSAEILKSFVDEFLQIDKHLINKNLLRIKIFHANEVNNLKSTADPLPMILQGVVYEFSVMILKEKDRDGHHEGKGAKVAS